MTNRLRETRRAQSRMSPRLCARNAYLEFLNLVRSTYSLARIGRVAGRSVSLGTLVSPFPASSKSRDHASSCAPRDYYRRPDALSPLAPLPFEFPSFHPRKARTRAHPNAREARVVPRSGTTRVFSCQITATTGVIQFRHVHPV